jgi:hypothetical protein
MCHKFPKALVGAIKRAKYPVDVKLGLVGRVGRGVLYGAYSGIHQTPSVGRFQPVRRGVVVLAVVGGFTLRDAVKICSSGNYEEKRPAGWRAGSSLLYPGHDGVFQSGRKFRFWSPSVGLPPACWRRPRWGSRTDDIRYKS